MLEDLFPPPYEQRHPEQRGVRHTAQGRGSEAEREKLARALEPPAPVVFETLQLGQRPGDFPRQRLGPVVGVVHANPAIELVQPPSLVPGPEHLGEIVRNPVPLELWLGGMDTTAPSRLC